VVGWVGGLRNCEKLPVFVPQVPNGSQCSMYDVIAKCANKFPWCPPRFFFCPIEHHNRSPYRFALGCASLAFEGGQTEEP
jgi:hypothetical protein